MELTGGAAVVFGRVPDPATHVANVLVARGMQVTLAGTGEFIEPAGGLDPRVRTGTADVLQSGDVREVLATASRTAPLRLVVNVVPYGEQNRVFSLDGNAVPLSVLEGTVWMELIGALNAVRLAGEAMATAADGQARDRGLVITACGPLAFDGQLGHAASSASHAGIIGMGLPMARELARWGIRVATVVVPGTHELPEGARAEAVARTVERIAANPAISGETVHAGVEHTGVEHTEVEHTEVEHTEVEHTEVEHTGLPRPGGRGRPDPVAYPVWADAAQLAEEGGLAEVMNEFGLLRRLLLAPNLPVATYREAARSCGLGGFDAALDAAVEGLGEFADDWSVTKTAAHVYALLRLDANIPGGLHGKVVEVGGGLGTLARVALRLFPVEEYHAIELGGVAGLQREFLAKTLDQGEASRAHVLAVADVLNGRCAVAGMDVGLSAFALTETPPAMQAWYAHHVLADVDRVFVLGRRAVRRGNDLRRLHGLLGGRFNLDVEPYVEEVVLGRPTFQLYGRRRGRDGDA